MRWGPPTTLSAQCVHWAPPPQGEARGKVPKCRPWLPLWGSWHGEAVTERADGQRRSPLPSPAFPISRSKCGKLLALCYFVIFFKIITNRFARLQPLTLSATLS